MKIQIEFFRLFLISVISCVLLGQFPSQGDQVGPVGVRDEWGRASPRK